MIEIKNEQNKFSIYDAGVFAASLCFTLSEDGVFLHDFLKERDILGLDVADALARAALCAALERGAEAVTVEQKLAAPFSKLGIINGGDIEAFFSKKSCGD